MERAVDFKWLWNTLEDHRMKYSTETTSHHIENTAQQASRFNKTYDIHSVGSGHGTTEYKGGPKQELNEKDMWWMTVPNKFTKNSGKEQTSSIPFVIERNYCNVVTCTAPDRVLPKHSMRTSILPWHPEKRVEAVSTPADMFSGAGISSVHHWSAFDEAPN